MQLSPRLEYHTRQPFWAMAFIINGCDQVYSDSMWQEVPDLKSLINSDWPQRKTFASNQAVRSQVEKFFESSYLTRWAQPEVNAVLANMPSTMMWDDHDIFDGWGLYPYEQHNCPVYQGILEVITYYSGYCRSNP